MLGAEGPKNVALSAEICDGWLPLFTPPRLAGMYNEWLDEGFARPGARRTREDFEICATAQVVITDDRPATMEMIKPFLALYMGGMGAEETNFHADVYRRMGYSEVVEDVTRLFRSGRKDEAAKVIPDELVDDAAIVGDVAYVREQIAVWEAAGVTMMVIGARSRADPGRRRIAVRFACGRVRTRSKLAGVTTGRSARRAVDGQGLAERHLQVSHRGGHHRASRQAQGGEFLCVGMVAEAQARRRAGTGFRWSSSPRHLARGAVGVGVGLEHLPARAQCRDGYALLNSIPAISARPRRPRS